jgi:phosphate transport system substrate-binding protein
MKSRGARWNKGLAMNGLCKRCSDGLSRRLLILGATFACLGGSSAALADPLTIQGSTTFNRRIMEPYQTEIETISGQQLTVIPNKSTPGLIALLEGRTHLAMISAPLETEVALLEKVIPGLSFEKLRAFEIDRSRVSFTVNRANPVPSATLDQIADILRGKITNWRSLGGPDLPIRAVLAGGGGIAVSLETGLLNGRPIAAPNPLYVNTPVQVVQVVNQEPGAIGFAQIEIVKKMGARELATDKPLEHVLYLVSLGEPTPAMRSVIDAARTVAARAM